MVLPVSLHCRLRHAEVIRATYGLHLSNSVHNPETHNLATQAATGSTDFAPPPRRGIGLSGYISTAFVSAANITAVVVVTMILARAWDEDQFLLYGKTNRYLNFLFCLTNGSLGYAIVRYGSFGEASKRKHVLFNAICLIGALTLLVSGILFIAIDDLIPKLKRTSV